MTDNIPAGRWPATTSEQAMQALELILSAIPGVKHVARQGVIGDLASTQLFPAILISTPSTRFEWMQRDSKLANIYPRVVLDLQASAQKSGNQRYHVSTVREAFARAVLVTLADNPGLKCQLDGEDSEEYHAVDMLIQLPTIRHVDVAEPYTRTLIELPLADFGQDVLEAESAVATWRSISLEIYPDASPADPYIPAFDFDVDDPDP